jgi:hypothetical protein
MPKLPNPPKDIGGLECTKMPKIKKVEPVGPFVGCKEPNSPAVVSSKMKLWHGKKLATRNATNAINSMNPEP